MARLAVRTRRPNGLVGANRAVANRLGLTALYLLSDKSAWRINQVTGAAGGVVAGSGVTWVDGLMRTPGVSGDGVTLETGISGASVPRSVLYGTRGISGVVSWSWMDETAFAWNGWYGTPSGDIGTSAANSFDGALALTGGVLVNGVYRYVASHDSATSLRGRVFGGASVVDTAALVPTISSRITLGWTNRSVDDNPAVADFEFFAAFNRSLSDSDQSALLANPWQLFAPTRKSSRVFTVASGVTIDANTGAALASDYAANVASPISVSAAVGAAVANDYAAGVSSAITISASAGAAVASDYAANVASAITVAGNVGAAVGAGLAASVSSGTTISATAGAALGAGRAAGVASPITVAASVGAATAAGLSAGISTGNAIAASTGAAVAVGRAAVVTSPITVAANVGAATASGLQASVGTGSTVPAGLGAAIALGLGATITATTQIVMSVGRAAAIGLDASVTGDTETATLGVRGSFAVRQQLAARRANVQTSRRRSH